MNAVKKIINNYYFQKLIIILGMFFSYTVLDIYIRYFSNKYVRLYKFTHAAPLLFTISWVVIFIGIISLFNKKGKMIIYPISIISFNILILAQTIYMQIFEKFFGLSDIFMAAEGSDYFKYALTLIRKGTIIVILMSIIATVITVFIIKKTEYRKKDIYDYLIIILLTILLSGSFRYLAINKLGKKTDPSTFDAAYNVRNVYEDFNNQAKNVEVSGIYEQTFKNSYLYIKERLSSDKKQISKEVFKELKNKENTSTKNEYTGMFKDKNLIFILLESIDSFLVNDEVMPTLNRLQNEGWNFTNRYAPTYGGGETINSEFAANTGFYAINNSKAIYNYNNIYPYSVPSIFKENGYSVNSVHQNSPIFYNRLMFHQNMGYENYYSLSTIDELKETYYYLDTNIIKNDKTEKYLFNKDNKFMTFLITYSPHMPYNDKNAFCDTSYGLEVEDNKELSCLRNLAHDTDEFLRMFIDKLDKQDLLDDTVLVMFTDHYLYAFPDQEYIKEVKNVDNFYMAQHVPFIIWSKDLKHKEIDTLMDTADIAPTVINLWGYEYDSRNYLGEDVFSKNRENFVYFGYNIFYDNKKFYDGSQNLKDDEKKYVNETLKKIKYNLDLNKKIILGDYFNNIDKIK